MTTSPVMSITEELVAELEFDLEVAETTHQLEASVSREALAALLAERAELLRDAERYRWLREDTSRGKTDLLICSKFWGNGAFRTQERILTGEGADAAIDAAMQSEAKL